MKFALLDGSDPSTAGPSQGEVNDWLAFDKAVQDAGVFVHEAGFQHVRTRARSASATARS